MSFQGGGGGKGNIAAYSVFSLGCEHKADTTDIAAGTNKTYDFTPPANRMWELVMLALSVAAPPGATSGTHRFEVKVMNSSSGKTISDVTSGKSVFGTSLMLNYNVWRYADSQQLPSTESGQIAQILSTIIDNDNPLRVTYFNNTDANQSNTPYLSLGYRIMKI